MLFAGAPARGDARERVGEHIGHRYRAPLIARRIRRIDALLVAAGSDHGGSVS
ncbi:hypothetical protein DB32_000536 [Sandaracinus amylolyticus]|uniref:Uncharacterized protein n=1 Tax=Sandaracinus amylolyticus TaxID=927083 RepID=A0A0F6VZ73_9BACT|nr:hypothetical protein DB32_000536 [Sandaracinus amylolyticus]